VQSWLSFGNRRFIKSIKGTAKNEDSFYNSNLFRVKKICNF